MRPVALGVFAVLMSSASAFAQTPPASPPPPQPPPGYPPPAGYPPPGATGYPGAAPPGYGQAPPGYAQPPAGYAPPPPGYAAPPGYAYPPYYGPPQREMPEELDAEAGHAPPAGYHEDTRYRKGLIITGSILLGVGYLPALSVASSSNNTTGDGWMAVPVLGPFLDLATRHSATGCDTNGLDCAEDAGNRTLITFDGLLQVSGAALLIIGLAAPRHLWVRDYGSLNEPVKPSWGFAPAHLGKTGNGAAIMGEFLRQ